MACAFSEGEFSSQPGNHDPVHSDQVFATLELKPETHFTPDQDQHTSWAEESYALEAEPETDLEQHRFSPTFGTTWLMTWVLLALGWLLPIPTAKDFVPQQAVASTSSVATKPSTGLRYRQIQDIRTGMRVIAKNPELEGQYTPDTEFDPPNCRNIHLRMKKPDGSDLHITLLRSVEGLQQRAKRWTLEELEDTAQSDSPAKPEIILDLEEIGAAGPATVLAVEACPNIEHGPGRVVTGTFHHSSAEVIDLYVTGAEKPIRTTSNHPFWSETRRKFVQAGQLNTNDLLRTTIGHQPIVRHILSHQFHSDVFNIEIDRDHCYAVTYSGILVHNTQDYTPDAPIKSMNVGEAGHHVPAIRKSIGRSFEVERTDLSRPTIHVVGDTNTVGQAHWRMHKAERLKIGPRQGDFDGTDRELFQAYRDSYQDLTDIRVDVRSPDGSVILGENLTLVEAINRLEIFLLGSP